MRIINVVVGIIKDKNKYLLTKRVHSDKRFHGKWQFPGGELETNESLIDCLHRELKEETNLEIINEEFIGKVFESFRDKSHFIFFTYRCVLKNKVNKIILDNETSDYGWFTFDEAVKLDSLDFTAEMLKQASI